MKIITPLDNQYPENLRNIKDPPASLYILGRIIKKDRRAIAVVGSRKMTLYGKKVAWEFAWYFAKKGITVVSGLARGIDSISHKAALEAGGRTIGVLGSGMDIIYPSENRVLVERVIKRGCVITEFPPGTKPLAKNFLSRNRIISGLSLGVLVVEGAKRSGTYSIANWAASQGKEVFAIPGRIDSPMSYLPNYLIESGAIIARRPEDVLQFLGLDS